MRRRIRAGTTGRRPDIARRCSTGAGAIADVRKSRVSAADAEDSASPGELMERGNRRRRDDGMPRDRVGHPGAQLQRCRGRGRGRQLDVNLREQVLGVANEQAVPALVLDLAGEACRRLGTEPARAASSTRWAGSPPSP